MDTKHNILLKLPLEIFEQFGLYLSIFDLANLELLSKDVRDRVLQTKLWKKSAFRLSRKFNFDLTKRMLSYASEKYINDAKKYKIILGIASHIRSAMTHLEAGGKKISGETRERLNRFREVFENENEDYCGDFLSQLVKLLVEQEILLSKMVQILSYNDDFIVLDRFTLKDADFSSNMKLEYEISDRKIKEVVDSDNVSDTIRAFSSWVHNRLKPMDSEIFTCAQIKSDSIIRQLREIHREEENEIGGGELEDEDNNNHESGDEQVDLNEN